MCRNHEVGPVKSYYASLCVIRHGTTNSTSSTIKSVFSSVPLEGSRRELELEDWVTQAVFQCYTSSSPMRIQVQVLWFQSALAPRHHWQARPLTVLASHRHTTIPDRYLCARRRYLKAC